MKFSLLLLQKWNASLFIKVWPFIHVILGTRTWQGLRKNPARSTQLYNISIKNRDLCLRAQYIIKFKKQTVITVRNNGPEVLKRWEKLWRKRKLCLFHNLSHDHQSQYRYSVNHLLVAINGALYLNLVDFFLFLLETNLAGIWTWQFGSAIYFFIHFIIFTRGVLVVNFQP